MTSATAHFVAADIGKFIGGGSLPDGGTIATVSSSNNDFGWNAGAGVMGYFSDHFGLRGDVRYLRNLQNNSTSVTDINFDPGSFHFWRASIGVVIR